MRISDWSSDVCSSDLVGSAKRISVLVIGPCVRSIRPPPRAVWRGGTGLAAGSAAVAIGVGVSVKQDPPRLRGGGPPGGWWSGFASRRHVAQGRQPPPSRSEEHTSELQSLMRNSYAVFCLKKKTKMES